jgi:SAM-dependent methyltransferase
MAEPNAGAAHVHRGRASHTYDRIGVGYAHGRRTDPRWQAAILEALGDASSVVNVGAGTGSYESGRVVLAVEPSAEMVGQRVDRGRVVRGVAEHLPARSGFADASTAILTVHHWADWRRGLAELRRVSRRQLVLAYDTAIHVRFWLVEEYFPATAELERSRPGAQAIAEELGADRMIPMPVPWDFTDGVMPAHWRRPTAYLDPAVRAACSGLAQLDPAALRRGVRALRADLDSGRWLARHADLLEAVEYDAGFRLIVRG